MAMMYCIMLLGNRPQKHYIVLHCGSGEDMTTTDTKSRVKNHGALLVSTVMGQTLTYLWFHAVEGAGADTSHM